MGALTDGLGAQGDADLGTSIETAEITDAAVTAAKIYDSTITFLQISDSTITSRKMTDSTILARKIADAQVDSCKLVDSCVSATKYDDSSIIGKKVADGTLVRSKLAQIFQTGRMVMTSDSATPQSSTAALVGFGLVGHDSVTVVAQPDVAVTPDSVYVYGYASDSATITIKCKTVAKADDSVGVSWLAIKHA